MDWHLLGNGVAALECALVLAWLSRIGVRGLRKLPVPVLVACLSLVVGTGIVAQKTNGVNNLPPMPLLPRSAPVVATVTEDDVARGWRVESVTTNETLSYAMPSNAVYVSNWHIHGARSSFGNNVVNLGGASASDWAFPLGTNGAAFSSFWYFVDGRIRPKPKDAAREICAVGVPMSAVPGKSRLWAMADGDCRVLTWENFFLGGDTNAPVNAQIRLFANGDFTTSSNDVETICRRVNPDDWDGDGIPNPDDANPMSCDGDFFGPANILPEGANTNAYCTVSVVATGPDSLITFAGDGPSNYPDPCFIAKSGVTNEVVILIGKTYQVSSDFPVSFAGASDPATEIVPLRGSATQVCRPVTITCSGDNPFTVSVFPANLNGSFLWNASNCCSIVASDGVFEFQCLSDCGCGGCNATGSYRYEGYGMSFLGNGCGCNHNQANVASLSFSASPIAILFEPEHAEANGLTVPRRSTFSRLACDVSNVDCGMVTIYDVSGTAGHLKFHLSTVDGMVVSLPYSCQVDGDVAIVLFAEGVSHGMTTNDIRIAAVYESADDVLGEEVALTVMEISTRTRSGHPNRQRKTLGVGEEVMFCWKPRLWDVVSVDDIVVSYDEYVIGTPHFATSLVHTVSHGGASLPFDFSVVEPQELSAVSVSASTNGPSKVAGDFVGFITISVLPSNVSFEAIQVKELGSVATNVFGYFSGMDDILDHGNKGADKWHGIGWHEYEDMVSISQVPPPWHQGGHFTWPITNAWRVTTDMAKHFPHRQKYDQTFELDSDGTVRIRKMGYVIQRNTNDVLTVVQEEE